MENNILDEEDYIWSNDSYIISEEIINKFRNSMKDVEGIKELPF